MHRGYPHIGRDGESPPGLLMRRGRSGLWRRLGLLSGCRLRRRVVWCRRRWWRRRLRCGVGSAEPGGEEEENRTARESVSERHVGILESRSLPVACAAARAGSRDRTRCRADAGRHTRVVCRVRRGHDGRERQRRCRDRKTGSHDFHRVFTMHGRLALASGRPQGWPGCCSLVSTDGERDEHAYYRCDSCMEGSELLRKPHRCRAGVASGEPGVELSAGPAGAPDH